MAISLELTQQQITQISDQIQSKLDQQSFWVKSNNPINLDWFKKLPMSLKAQFDGIGKKLGFPTNFDNLPYLLTYVFILFVIGGLIFKFKESIKQRLSVILYGAFIVIRYPLVFSSLPTFRLFLCKKSTRVLGMVAQYGGLLVVL